MQHSSSSAGPNDIDYGALDAIAAAIHTVGALDDNSRALIVFNVSASQARGTGRFVSAVTWPIDLDFPGVFVSTWIGDAVGSKISDLLVEPDRKGRAERVRLTFNLDFYVDELEGRNWQTYIARFAQGVKSGASADLEAPHPDLIVLEAALQAGELGPYGTF